MTVPASPPSIHQVYETVLYVDDLEAAASFYQVVLGLQRLSQNDLMLVFAMGDNYLLLFDPRKSSPPGRPVPSHGTSGPGHVAFLTDPNDLPQWRAHLRRHGVAIEAEVDWDNGNRGTSLYFRDPAGNSLELAPQRLWSYLRTSN